MNWLKLVGILDTLPVFNKYARWLAGKIMKYKIDPQIRIRTKIVDSVSEVRRRARALLCERVCSDIITSVLEYLTLEGPMTEMADEALDWGRCVVAFDIKFKYKWAVIHRLGTLLNEKKIRLPEFDFVIINSMRKVGDACGYTYAIRGFNIFSRNVPKREVISADAFFNTCCVFVSNIDDSETLELDFWYGRAKT